MTVKTTSEAMIDLERRLRERADRTAGLTATYEFRLSGEDGGEWHLVFDSGAFELLAGKAEHADAVIAMSSEDFVALHEGRLEPSLAFATGRMRVSGDSTLGMRLGGVLRDEAARTVSPDPVIRLATSYMAAKYLFVANELGVFEQLAEGGLQLEELASRCGVPARSLRIVLDALVGLEILESRPGGYCNGPSAATFLTGRSPVDLRPHLRFWNRLSYPRWLQLETAVRTDGAVARELDAEERRLASEGVEAITARVALTLAVGYEFEKHHRLLDLGGGTGSFLIAAARNRGSLRGTLLEQAPVLPIASRRIAEAGLADRLEAVEGDLFEGPIPAEHDAILLANVMHMFRAERNRDLLRRVRHAAEPDTRLLLLDTWTGEDRSKPLQAALTAGEYLLANGGEVHSVGEVAHWLAATGWKYLEHRPLIGSASLILAETAHNGRA